VEITTIPLKPFRDMREIKGPLDMLIKAGLENPAGQNDLIHATVTDDEEMFDVLGQLRNVYPNILRLDFENSRTAVSEPNSSAGIDVENKSPLELFTDFYLSQNNIDMTEKQLKWMEKVFDEAGERLI
jgi:exonuclease SbcD